MSEPNADAAVRRLFAPPVRTATLLLWAAAVLVFASLYELVSWLPTLVVGLGVQQQRAPIALAALGIGGVLGVALAMAFVRAGLARVLVGFLAAAAGCLLLVGLVPLPGTALFVAVAGAGAGVVTTTAGLAAVALRVYPRPLRATGIGWGAALGRSGSVVGPAAGGAMLTRGLEPETIFLLTAVPVVLVAALAVRLRRTSGALRSDSLDA